MHVVDITHPDAAQQAETVQDTLRDLDLSREAGGQRRSTRSTCWRATTATPSAGLEELREQSDLLSHNRPDALLISAQNGWGLDELRRRIETVLDEGVAAITPARSRWSIEEKRPAG